MFGVHMADKIITIRFISKHDKDVINKPFKNSA